MSDPVTYTGVVVVLLAVATAASVTPAPRILCLDPATTSGRIGLEAQGSRKGIADLNPATRI